METEGPAVPSAVIRATRRGASGVQGRARSAEPAGGSRSVRSRCAAGHAWVVDADLQSAFATIPPDRWRARIPARVADGPVLAPGERFLRAGVLEETKGGRPPEGGAPQGGVIRPLLANRYLDPLDQHRARAGWERVRYADDFVIRCRTEAEAQSAWAAVSAWGSAAGLTLHPDQTRVGDARAPGGWDFLGWHFERGLKWPRPKRLEPLQDRVRAQTGRLDGRRGRAIVTDVNRTLRGGDGYFPPRRANVFAEGEGSVRRRLRRRLEKRRGRTRYGLGAAHPRWPNKWLAHHGRRSLQAAHAWTRTIVGLRTHGRESRMREIRPSGSEGGGAGNRSPYPYRQPGWPPLQCQDAPVSTAENWRRDGQGVFILESPQ